jgi:hypothetical protein
MDRDEFMGEQEEHNAAPQKELTSPMPLKPFENSLQFEEAVQQLLEQHRRSLPQPSGLFY